MQPCPTPAPPPPRPPSPPIPSQPATYKKYASPDSLAHLVPGLPPDGVDLLARLLQQDPAKRASAAETLAHPFFADLPPALRVGGLHGGVSAVR